MPETSYGTEEFLRACRLEATVRAIQGSGPRATWGRLRAESALTRYHRRLPVAQIRLTNSPSGRMIGEHLAIRAAGDWRYRRAQGVLSLPPDSSDYMRGRHRQAVRTNVGHARRAGLVAVSCAMDNWAPGADDTRAGHITTGPVERWMVFDADGFAAADSILSVDEEVALLHGLVSFTKHARWLLHTAIVERLCGDCDVLLTNSDDAYLLGPGTRHFQQLLGYEISRLHLARPRAAASAHQPAGLSWPPAALSCGVAIPTAAPALLAA